MSHPEHTRYLEQKHEAEQEQRTQDAIDYLSGYPLEKANTMEHTPGPWEAGAIYKSSTSSDCYGVIFTPEKSGKFHTPRAAEVFGIDKNEALANARLIAAAPELLAALKNLMARAVTDAERYATEGNEPIWAFIADASDAIAKAEGND